MVSTNTAELMRNFLHFFDTNDTHLPLKSVDQLGQLCLSQHCVNFSMVGLNQKALARSRMLLSNKKKKKKVAWCTRLLPLQSLGGANVCSLIPACKETVFIFQIHDLQIIVKQHYDCAKAHPLRMLLLDIIMENENPFFFPSSNSSTCK